MHIDWMALLSVTGVTIVATIGIVTVVAFAAKFMDAARVQRNNRQPARAYSVIAGSLFAVAGLVVLFGIYLIVPYWH